MNARELRLWHWRKAMAERAAAARHPGDNRWDNARRGQHSARADWHIGAVQVLNDHPGCPENITAEDDDATFPRPRQSTWRGSKEETAEARIMKDEQARIRRKRLRGK